ncbi:stretch-activated Ca2+-permeable channel component-domain-containing protein [Phakopsora pachyrhizi]|nr:stretch-activated Ca2+-permeable channel component-domain-containing protein [Phakopsora pachyrhizi]
MSSSQTRLSDLRNAVVRKLVELDHSWNRRRRRNSSTLRPFNTFILNTLIVQLICQVSSQQHQQPIQINLSNTSNSSSSSSSVLSFDLLSSSSQSFYLPPPSVPTETSVTLNICSFTNNSASVLSSPSANDLIQFLYPDLLIISNSSELQNPSIDNLPITHSNSKFILPNQSNSQNGDRSDSVAGFASSTILNSQGLWINVRAPPPLSSSNTNKGNTKNDSSSTSTSQRVSLQLGISTGLPVHSSLNRPAFKFEDSDDSSVLLTAADSSLFLPFSSNEPFPLSQIYPIILPTPSNLSIGLSSSSCYLQSFNLSTSKASVPMSNVVSSLTIRGTGLGMISSQLTSNLSETGSRISPERAGKRVQYQVNGLRPDTNYTAWLFQPNSLNVPNIQTGKLWPYINFRTKSSSKCKLVHDLSFCPNVAYSVPNPQGMTIQNLIQAYNQSIFSTLANFSTVISTYPCNNDTSGRYSFVSGCGDCLRAYTDWACSVMMPRCTDPPNPSNSFMENNTRLTSTGSFLQQPDPINNFNGATVLNRIASNVSRTPQFPSSAASNNLYPYGEIPPCLSTCTLVQATCPAFVGFKCPELKIDDLTRLNYGTARGLNEVEVLGGQNIGGVGRSGYLRAGDRFGNVYCNGLDSDLSYSRISQANREFLASVGGKGKVTFMVSVLGFVLFNWLVLEGLIL